MPHDAIGKPIRATYFDLRGQIALAEDEVGEVRDAWAAGRCKCAEIECDHGVWGEVRAEAMQAAAVLIRLVRTIDEGRHRTCPTCPAGWEFPNAVDASQPSSYHFEDCPLAASPAQTIDTQNREGGAPIAP